mmetsp:Transcript_96862/g.215970  ORF Transcript_96862/g.215970 Transcript_96862/m.215970 type:complete len:302 (+) Transcript_96862:620-1525(+)
MRKAHEDRREAEARRPESRRGVSKGVPLQCRLRRRGAGIGAAQSGEVQLAAIHHGDSGEYLLELLIGATGGEVRGRLAEEAGRQEEEGDRGNGAVLAERLPRALLRVHQVAAGVVVSQFATLRIMIQVGVDEHDPAGREELSEGHEADHQRADAAAPTRWADLWDEGVDCWKAHAATYANAEAQGQHYPGAPGAGRSEAEATHEGVAYDHASPPAPAVPDHARDHIAHRETHKDDGDHQAADHRIQVPMVTQERCHGPHHEHLRPFCEHHPAGEEQHHHLESPEADVVDGKRRRLRRAPLR